MKLFLDTSSLFKLYHAEKDSYLVEDLFKTNTIVAVFLSELTKTEFASSVWKKWRLKEINEPQVNVLLKSFEDDFKKYSFVPVDSAVIEQARWLLDKYGRHGLRTLDSIQLSTALFLRSQAGLFKSADKLLTSFLVAEGLPTS